MEGEKGETGLNVRVFVFCNTAFTHCSLNCRELKESKETWEKKERKELMDPWE